MNKKEYHTITLQVRKKIDDLIHSDSSTYNGVRFNPYTPLRELFYLMCVKAENDKDYYEEFTKWLLKGGTLLTREITESFEDEIITKFFSNKYPLPFDNAVERLNLIIWRLDK